MWEEGSLLGTWKHHTVLRDPPHPACGLFVQDQDLHTELKIPHEVLSSWISTKSSCYQIALSATSYLLVAIPVSFFFLLSFFQQSFFIWDLFFTVVLNICCNICVMSCSLRKQWRTHGRLYLDWNPPQTDVIITLKLCLPILWIQHSEGGSCFEQLFSWDK